MIDYLSLPKTPCVYKWTNLANGKVYIGETINVLKRIRRYESDTKNDLSVNCAIIKAFRKYGFENFKFELLEVFPNRHEKEKQILIQREKFWISLFDSTNKKKGYNLLPFGRGFQKGHMLSEETRRKKKARFMGSNHPMFGKKHSEESRKLMSKNYNMVWTQEARDKLSKSKKGVRINNTKRKIYQIDKTTESIVAEFESIEAAALHMGGISKISCIKDVLAGRAKTAFKYKWEYADGKGPIKYNYKKEIS